MRLGNGWSAKGSPGVEPGSSILESFQLIFYGKIWVNYNELTTSSLEIIISKGNHPQMALIQVCELL